MINEIIQAIANKLADLYPEYEIYSDDVPQDFSTPSFLIVLADHDYSKRIYGNSGKAIMDVAYFSDKGTQEIKGDCRTVQENLLRNFDMIGAFRAIGKNARTVDNVLHLTFNVGYSEINITDETVMEKQQTNTNL
jgi:hypothetical protein